MIVAMGRKMKSRTGNLNGDYFFGISLILVWLLMFSTAFAQQNGILEGRLVNGTDPKIVPGGVTLEILAMSGGMSIIRTAESDSSGKFRVEGLPVDSMLMLRAYYNEASYNEPIRFDDSAMAQVELEVFEATTSMNDIVVEEYQMVFQAAGDYLQSLDTIVLSNETDPPRTFMNPEGNYRFSKAPSLESMPQVRITAPGSIMPVVQTALESPDGQSYYTLYPIRPGKTTVDVFQMLPYGNRNYTYVKMFYNRIPSVEIGVIPMDVELSGPGLSRIRTDPEENIAVYRSGPIEAGTKVEWTFSGGTPVAVEEGSPAGTGSKIIAAPNGVGRKATLIASLLLLGFVAVLWYAFNRGSEDHAESGDARKRRLEERREVLLNRIVDLDRRYEKGSLNRRQYIKQHEEGMRMLRRITVFLQENSSVEEKN